ncbi:DUF402 domain-containing protein [Kitasatospora sp. NBC_01287]|uniref:DUF402 domain-containing protein n=1 Tax=Kitasatospora sp. NBC_01287 TaxID=2903573 RepID=UPI002259BB4B|nr:DUF402 domain-containing protein [Kitasatospora sp. NBC_01287]MCX4748770.1 DUF402 domain-containing protein [Kitasatospora sp. NBC_01287]
MALEPGRILDWHFSFGGQLISVCPVRVVVDTPEALVLWLAARTPCWEARLPGGRHIRDLDPAERPPGGYPLAPDLSRPGPALIHQPHGAGHAVWWVFDHKRRFKRWYVNLEERTRQDHRILVTDLELDLVVAADRSWQWKDEESFRRKTGLPGYWTAQQAATARAEGERVAALVEAAAFPFDGTWCDYTPPADWTLPPLPAPPVGALLTDALLTDGVTSPAPPAAGRSQAWPPRWWPAPRPGRERRR